MTAIYLTRPSSQVPVSDILFPFPLPLALSRLPHRFKLGNFSSMAGLVLAMWRPRYVLLRDCSRQGASDLHDCRVLLSSNFRSLAETEFLPGPSRGASAVL